MTTTYSGDRLAQVAARQDEAQRVLRDCGVPFGVDFHTLPQSKIEALLAHADIHKYRKPKNANGSRARYFHDLMQRRAAALGDIDYYPWGESEGKRRARQIRAGNATVYIDRRRRKSR